MRDFGAEKRFYREKYNVRREICKCKNFYRGRRLKQNILCKILKLLKIQHRET